MPEALQPAYALACEVRQRAHAPYSSFLVGAVAKAFNHDELSAGCNVENASYGATVCAERNAIFALTARIGRPRLEYVLLVTDTTPAAMPCALCPCLLASSSLRLRLFLGPEAWLGLFR